MSQKIDAGSSHVEGVTQDGTRGTPRLYQFREEVQEATAKQVERDFVKVRCEVDETMVREPAQNFERGAGKNQW